MKRIHLHLIAMAMMSIGQTAWGQGAVPAWSPEPPVALPPVQYAKEYEAKQQQKIRARWEKQQVASQPKQDVAAETQTDLKQQYLQSSTQYAQTHDIAGETCNTCGIDSYGGSCSSGCGIGGCNYGSCDYGNCGYGSCGTGGCEYGACSPCCPVWTSQLELLFMHGGLEAGFDGGDTDLVVVPRFTLQRESAGGLGYRLRLYGASADNDFANITASEGELFHLDLEVFKEIPTNGNISFEFAGGLRYASFESDVTMNANRTTTDFDGLGIVGEGKVRYYLASDRNLFARCRLGMVVGDVDSTNNGVPFTGSDNFGTATELAMGYEADTCYCGYLLGYTIFVEFQQYESYLAAFQTTGRDFGLYGLGLGGWAKW